MLATITNVSGVVRTKPLPKPFQQVTSLGNGAQVVLPCNRSYLEARISGRDPAFVELNQEIQAHKITIAWADDTRDLFNVESDIARAGG